MSAVTGSTAKGCGLSRAKQHRREPGGPERLVDGDIPGESIQMLSRRTPPKYQLSGASPIVVLLHWNRSLKSLVAGLAAAPSSGPTWKISSSVFRVELWS